MGLAAKAKTKETKARYKQTAKTTLLLAARPQGGCRSRPRMPPTVTRGR